MHSWLVDRFFFFFFHFDGKGVMLFPVWHLFNRLVIVSDVRCASKVLTLVKN